MRYRLFLTLALFLTHAASVEAEDWPQILGKNRDGNSAAAKLKWSTKPVEAWSVPAGEGFAGPVVVGDRVLLYDRRGGEERLRALSRDTGKELWLADFPADYRGSINPDSGPRCVPLVEGDTVVLYGAGGDAHGVRLSDGEKLWSRELLQVYRGREGYFGVGSTPIAFGQRVLFNVGGKDAGIVALDLTTGETLWKATREGASYSSPIKMTVDGKELAVFVARLNLVGIDPFTGKVLLKFPFGRSGPTVNGAMPQQVDTTKLFLTSSYGIGGVLLDVSGKSPKPVWKNDSSMSSQYNTPLDYQGHLYGIHGREDGSPAEFRCVALDSGKVQWSQPGMGVAHSLLLGDKLLIMTYKGTLIAAQATPERFDELNRATISKSICRALPAYCDGVFYFRDEKRLVALKLGES